MVMSIALEFVRECRARDIGVSGRGVLEKNKGFLASAEREHNSILFTESPTDSRRIFANKPRLVAPFYDGYTYPLSYG